MLTRVIAYRMCTALLFAFWFLAAFGAVAEANVGGWCAASCRAGEASQCFASPHAACYFQYVTCGGGMSPKVFNFGGARDTTSWDIKICKWQKRPGGSGPGGTSFRCETPGSTKVAPGQCLFSEEVDDKERPPCRHPAGSNANPSTPNPISILTGAKLLRVTDFETADGRLRVSRTYRSTPIGKTHVAMHEPSGLGAGWRLDFLPEIELPGNFAATSYVTLHAPDGASYDFQRQGDGTMKPAGWGVSMASIPHQEYRLEFDGPWPNPLSEVVASASRWRLTDPAGDVWTLEGSDFLDLNNPTGNPADWKYLTVRPVSRTTRDGYQQFFEYDGEELFLSSVTDSFGRTLSFNWLIGDITELPDHPDLRIRPLAIERIALPDGTSLRYHYDSIGGVENLLTFPASDRLVRVERIASDGLTVLESTIYHHELSTYPTRVTGITDARGVRAWNFAYDSRGRAVSSAKAGGVDAWTLEYSAQGANPPWREVTTPGGRTSRYRYSATSNTRLIGIDGEATPGCAADASSITYSATGFIASTTDREGRLTTYVRDSRGRPTTVTEAAGTPDARVTTRTWHPVHDRPTSVVRAGLTTTYGYDGAGRLTSLTRTDTTTHTVPYATNGQARTWAFTYAAGGLLSTVDGPLPGPVDVVEFDYDASGYLAAVTNEAGHVTEVASVNGRGQPTAIVDPNRVTTVLAYDAVGRTTGITRDPGGVAAHTTIEYDAVGDITRITRPDGSWLSYAWDDARRLTAITSDAGETIEYGYGATSLAESVTVRWPGGAVAASRAIEHDEIGRVRRLLGAGLQSTTLEYDREDNPASRTDPRGGLYDYAFDRLDRLVSEIDPELGVTTLSWDAGDQLTAVTDAEALTTTYVRNGFGDVIRRVSPDTGVTDYVVDARGLVTSTTDARGVVTNFTWDALGRMLTQSWPSSPAEDIAYTWDVTSGGSAGIGRLGVVTDASGSTAYRYDALGRPVEVTRTSAGVVHATSYEYDAADRVTGITYPSGRVVEYLRDASGRIETITTRPYAGGPVVPVVSDVAWMPFSPSSVFADGASPPDLGMPHLSGLASLTYGNGLELLLNVDADGNLTGMRTSDGSTVVQDLTFACDAASAITAITDNVDPSRSQSFDYDGVGRLVWADGAYGEIDYGYDLVGNCTRRTCHVSRRDGDRGGFPARYRRDPESPTHITNPTVVFEITSPGTVDYDRGEKLDHYRSIPSLEAIVIVDHASTRVELWTRIDAGWSLRTLGEGEEVPIDAIAASIPIDEIYAAAREA